MTDYVNESVTSVDGSMIAYRRLGTGPAVILLHGGMLAAQHLMKLARAMATDFTCVVPDRRGRGRSGPHGDQFGIMREVEDVQALAAATGATRIFGLSSGALVALRSALASPSLDRVALYEPPLSIDGSVPVAWVPRYEREVAAGRTADALITALNGLDIEPVLGRVPRFVLRAFLPLALRADRRLPPDDVTIEALVPTQRFDMRLVRELADSADDYSALAANVLLMGGDRSPVFLTMALDELGRVLPHARRMTFRRLGHSGPENDGDPARVAGELRTFFTAAPRP
jgi:pimeloyl-ACP methyl ester carboxylesterase